MAEAEKWICVAEAARELGKSERTIRRQCEAGKLHSRLEKTESGKTWMVCLAPVDDVAEAVAEGTAAEQPPPLTSTRGEDTAAIVPVSETSAAKTTANSKILAEVSEVRHEVEQIKTYLVGQMSAQMSEQMDERLSQLPTRDDFREDITTLISSTLLPVMQRMETLVSENAQLQNALHNEKQKTLAQVCRPWWKRLFS